MHRELSIHCQILSSLQVVMIGSIAINKIIINFASS
nr:MAG TPA: hypothetical protein [Caudoviricetes sp.]